MCYAKVRIENLIIEILLSKNQQNYHLQNMYVIERCIKIKTFTRSTG